MNVSDVMREDQARGGASTDDAPPTSKRYYDLWQTKQISRDPWLQQEQGIRDGVSCWARVIECYRALRPRAHQTRA